MRKPLDHDAGSELTEEELDALIAEQSKPENLPTWWDDDSGKTARVDGKSINESRNELRRRTRRKR
jgi:hypothetical protein